ncbi:transcriptional regulator [Lysinibacillus sphaericus]|uniref:transcriptional regulator n=1 Tax=Lysinibacillus sphaericus TaxID=1421 RepID=UPI001C5E0CA9
MKEQLVKAMQRGQFINMIYVSKSGEITKRRVKIIQVVGDSFTAFCFTRQATRTFLISNLLAVIPFVSKGRVV